MACLWIVNTDYRSVFYHTHGKFLLLHPNQFILWRFIHFLADMPACKFVQGHHIGLLRRSHILKAPFRPSPEINRSRGYDAAFGFLRS